MRLALLLVLVAFSYILPAQVVLKGKVMDSKSDLPLDGVTIFNKTQKLFRKAGQDGLYVIPTKDKDTIIFSFTGYRSDTIVILLDLLQGDLDIGLKALPPMLLDTVTVK